MRLLLVPALIAITVTGCGKPAEEPKGGGFPPPPVGVAAAIERPLPTTKVFTGRIEAIESVELKPRVSGLVVAVLVADGATVKTGDVLLRIDDAPFKATVAHAQADIAQAEADIAKAKAGIQRADVVLAQADSQLVRAKQLITDNVMSRQAYDAATVAVAIATAEKSASEGGLAAATAALAAAKAALITATLDLEHTQVVAPIAGTLGKVLTTVGSLVQGGGPAPATTIAVLNRSDTVYAAFDVDEPTWATRPTGRIPVAVGLSGEAGFPHAGAVAFADNQIDTATGAIRVRAALENADGRLIPGAFARVQVELAPAKPVLLINERAVQAQLATRYVLTVDEQGGTAFRPVRLGARVGALRVVEEGLKPGERIAVNNLAKIFFPGMPVSPVPASMETLQNDGAPAAGAGAHQ